MKMWRKAFPWIIILYPTFWNNHRPVETADFIYAIAPIERLGKSSE